MALPLQVVVDLCPSSAAFFGFMGVSSALVFASEAPAEAAAGAAAAGADGAAAADSAAAERPGPRL